MIIIIIIFFKKSFPEILGSNGFFSRVKKSAKKIYYSCNVFCPKRDSSTSSGGDRLFARDCQGCPFGIPVYLILFKDDGYNSTPLKKKRIKLINLFQIDKH